LLQHNHRNQLALKFWLLQAVVAVVLRSNAAAAVARVVLGLRRCHCSKAIHTLAQSVQVVRLVQMATIQFFQQSLPRAVARAEIQPLTVQRVVQAVVLEIAVVQIDQAVRVIHLAHHLHKVTAAEITQVVRFMYRTDQAAAVARVVKDATWIRQPITCSQLVETVLLQASLEHQ
jgi:hypothetical protein